MEHSQCVVRQLGAYHLSPFQKCCPPPSRNKWCSYHGIQSPPALKTSQLVCSPSPSTPGPHPQCLPAPELSCVLREPPGRELIRGRGSGGKIGQRLQSKWTDKTTSGSLKRSIRKLVLSGGLLFSWMDTMPVLSVHLDCKRWLIFLPLPLPRISSGLESTLRHQPGRAAFES